MRFQPGTLVSARGRDWTVLPESSDELLLLRPLDGTDDETTGILTSLEQVTQSEFSLPDPKRSADAASCGLMRDALRLGIRKSAGPFRSFGKIAVEPRPYQFVPLMLAMKQDPVRILIADDVGIGKTIEAGIIIKELLERGDCNGLSVLCPPSLAEQWQRELHDKFHIDAKLVLPGTIRKLEREKRPDESLFEVYPYTVVSIDFIKGDMKKDDYVRNAPNLVVIDEAHAVSHDATTGTRHERYRLAKELCAPEWERNVILVTATPHSGDEGAFRSLLGLLNPAFENLPEDLTGQAHEKERREVARYLVQRRRRDLSHFLEENTVFPQREEQNPIEYELSPTYMGLFDRAIDFARGVIKDPTGGDKRVERVRWWSILSLLRALASSPAAAEATLRNRSRVPGNADPREIEKIGEKSVLDLGLEESDSIDSDDMPLGCSAGEEDPQSAVPILTQARREELKKMADEVKGIFGDEDRKMLALVPLLKKLLKDGYSPIVFCRFIQTVDYLRDELRSRLKGAEIEGVDGTLPPEERERRVDELGNKKNRVLICTDCLSEGINLQNSFNAVIHYDLSWNPTRHEQREGRVDRFGQAAKTVKMLTLYSKDNYIDSIILKILLKKHRLIKSSLGVSVAMPASSKEMLEAMINAFLTKADLSRASAKKRRISQTKTFAEFDEYMEEVIEADPAVRRLEGKQEKKVEQQKRSKSMFAQFSFENRTGEILRELQLVRKAVGSSDDVRGFVLNTLTEGKAHVVKTDESKDHYKVSLSGIDDVMRDYIADLPCFDSNGEGIITFSLPKPDEIEYITRTHPLTEALADYVLNTALDSESEKSLAGRCGVMRTSDVESRTVLLLLRNRYQLRRRGKKAAMPPLIAEDAYFAGFTKDPVSGKLTWLSDEENEKLLAAKPTGNISPGTAEIHLKRVLDDYPLIEKELRPLVQGKAEELGQAHDRVRTALDAGQTGAKTRVEPRFPPDIIGIYIFMP